MRQRRRGLLLGLAALFAASGAGADPLRLHLEAGAARAIAGTQANDTGWGWVGGAALELVILPAIGVEIELAHIGLSAGDPPVDPTIAQKGASSAQTAMVGARVRPAANVGLFLSAGGGVAKTGDLVRPALGAGLGFELLWPGFGIGPFVGYHQIVQPNDTLRPDDAKLLLFGLEGTLGVRTKKAPKPIGDRDHDGVLDNVDACPDVPEDRDGYHDEDGCPDADNDGDGIPDVGDACPNEPGPRTSDPKTNGCPVRDRDGDGVPDDVDKCPDDPEDKDLFQDEDGCPDPDNDKDGIPDAKDQCPNEPETMNGYADEDGCPDEVQVRVVGDKILLDDRVHFQTNRSIVLADSQPLLWRVAMLIKKHPEYTHLEVTGYADERGAEAYNQKLSEERAKAVMEMLIRYGVARGRLSAVGHGTANPRISDSNDKAWRENRRTEFNITRETKETAATPLPGVAEPAPAAPAPALPPPPDPGGSP